MSLRALENSFTNPPHGVTASRYSSIAGVCVLDAESEKIKGRTGVKNDAAGRSSFPRVRRAGRR